ncbi:hypothetical protein OG233_10760 [Streptomyces sp. NBC_01218]|uniref:hypothetical protein n=1 Tax=unclassified Streptomyces TaxID=2593676 RepID=UPI002E1103A5|nr:hypothetical protein OG233_10760 [Streptomyces sp. NBC_01218]
MPAASFVAGAAVGVAADRLLEDRADVPPLPRSHPYGRHGRGGRTGGHDWRARGHR